MTLDELTDALRAFAAERDWDQFHTPKNLAMALAGEAGELLAEYQWLTPQESLALDDQKQQAVADEMGDVLIYLVRLADVAGIDLLEAASAKLQLNRRRYNMPEQQFKIAKTVGRAGDKVCPRELWWQRLWWQQHSPAIQKSSV